MADLYYIACSIERGAFSSERVFEIQLSQRIKTYEGETSGKLVGTAHADHLRDSSRQALAEDQPEYAETIDGFVLCRKLKELGSGWIIAEVPSADVIHVAEDSLVPMN